MFEPVNDYLRGHSFLPDDLLDIPPLYSQDGMMGEELAYIHYFAGGCDWYITEVNQIDGMSFGWSELMPGCGEFGYVGLEELESLRIPMTISMDVLGDGTRKELTVNVYVERDLDWKPIPVNQAIERRKKMMGEES